MLVACVLQCARNAQRPLSHASFIALRARRLRGVPIPTFFRRFLRVTFSPMRRVVSDQGVTGRERAVSLATMNANNLLTVVALAASILLMLKASSRLFPVIALVASAIEVLRAFGIVSFKVPVIGAALLFGGAMVVGGVGSWIRASNKVPVTAAVLVALVGLLRVLGQVM